MAQLCPHGPYLEQRVSMAWYGLRVAMQSHSSSSGALLLLTRLCRTWSQVRVEIESLAEGVDLSEPLTRARFEELVGDLLKKTLGPVRKARTHNPSAPPASHADAARVNLAAPWAGRHARLGGWQRSLFCCTYLLHLRPVR